jgi:hypothetical protein
MSPSAPTSPAAEASPAREALTDAALLAVDALLTAGAALRVARFATTDVLGGWALSDPLHRLADRLEPGQPFGYLAPSSAPLHRLVSALDCPFCVGTQAALVIGAALAATSSRTAPSYGPLRPHRHRRSPLGRALRAASASLAAAYVVGHVSHRLDTPAATATATATAATEDPK